MIITKIEKQKNKQNRYSVFINNKFCFGLSDLELANLKLQEGQTIDKQKYKYIYTTIIFNKAKNVAIKYISYKMRTEYQLRKKLKECDFHPKIIDAVVNITKKYGYINDYEYAKAFLNEKLNITKHGLNKIKYNLKLAGVNKDIIDKVFQENEFDEVEIAFELLLKKTRMKDDLNFDYKQKQKLIAYLQRRGFNYDSIKQALDRLVANY